MVDVNTIAANVNTPFDFLDQVNIMTSGVYMIGVLLLLWVVIYGYASKTMPSGLEAFTYSSMSISILGMLLFWGGLLTWYWLFIPILAFGIGFSIMHSK